MPRRPDPYTAAALERLPSPVLGALRRTINAILHRRREADRLEEALLAHEEQLSRMVAVLTKLAPADQALLDTLLHGPEPASTDKDAKSLACQEPLRWHLLTTGFLLYQSQAVPATVQGTGFARTHESIRRILVPTELGLLAWDRWRASKTQPFVSLKML